MRHSFILAILFACGLHGAEPAPDPAAVKAAMEQMRKTGPEHAALAQMVGIWDVKASMWMTPDAPPEVTPATATCTSLFGGKWIRQEYQGVMMGQPFSGIGMNGYDTVAKRYVSTWCDNFSTMMTTMSGSSTDGGKTITYTSELAHCPMTGGPVAYRYVLVHESPMRMVFTMFQTPKGGVEQKSMELIYSRRP